MMRAHVRYRYRYSIDTRCSFLILRVCSPADLLACVFAFLPASLHLSSCFAACCGIGIFAGRCACLKLRGLRKAATGKLTTGKKVKRKAEEEEEEEEFSRRERELVALIVPWTVSLHVLGRATATPTDA